MDFTLNEDSSLDFELTSFDVEGAEVSYSIITSPLYGSLEFLGDSNYRYIPDFNYFGLDSFTFNVSDGFLNSNIAEINLEVLGINDPPIGTTFNIITDEDQIYSFEVPNVIDVDNDDQELSIILLSNSSLGTFEFNGLSGIFTPINNLSGFDSIDFQIYDGVSLSEIYQAVIVVNEINDAPVLTDIPDQSIDEDTVFTYTLTATDVDDTRIIIQRNSGWQCQRRCYRFHINDYP